MPSNILNMTINNTQNIPIVIGNTSSFNINIQNTSSTQKLYNLGLTLTLPDGLVLTSATAPQTSSVTNANNSITYSWINIKDLAPFESPYVFTLTIKCNTTFKNGTTIPFGYNFSGISVSSSADTMPRGSYDIGNEVLTSTISMTYVTSRFYSTITTSGKVLKGAGTSISLNDYTQVTTATCKFYNNSISSSPVNITILLDDGIRYIGNISTSGTDSSKLTNPLISSVIINGKLYTQLYFGNITLSINSNTTLIFNYSVWNKYVNNTGSLISHGTTLNMKVNMSSSNPLIISSSNSSTSFSAMDLIITTSVSKSILDVQDNIDYTYVYSVGQYYSIQNIVVNYLLPDGIYYISSSVTPTSVIDDPLLKGFYLTYNFPLASANSSMSVTISTTVESYYRYKFDSQLLNLPIVAFDSFLGTTNITGILTSLITSVEDSDSVSSTIAISNISKQFIKGYYSDGTLKDIDALAPGDLAEYLLTYDASTLKAIQKEIYIDDFFPLSANPIDNLIYNYTGIQPLSDPMLIDPHGVEFYYGNIPGLSTGTINFLVPIYSLGSSTQNTNLMKTNGINTLGVAYSNRTQVNIAIGTPNLTLSKIVTGPNKNAIKANEIYSYTVTINNSNNLGTETDAFDFTLSDTLSTNWFTLNVDSVTITGTGSFNPPVIGPKNIYIYINKLAPGESLTLNYTVTINPILAPGVTITTTATNTNPYSQIYNPSSTNFQYSNLNKSASTTIYSPSITLTKSRFPDTFKVGSKITYTLTVTVPLGTIAYGLYLKDILPNGGQSYTGPSFRNGVTIIPTISSNTVTFPTEGTIDSRTSSQSISYIFTATITNSNKTLNTTTSPQTNTAQCFYQQIEGGSYTIINRNLNITVNHPNLLLTLNTTDRSTGIQSNSNITISTNSLLQFKLMMKNNSAISLINGTVTIPLNNKFTFLSIDNNSLCTSVFNISTNTITISIPNLPPSSTSYIIFSVNPLGNTRAGALISTQALAVSYYNDISTTKVYGGESSNIVNAIISPAVSLKPNPIYQINPSTSYIVTPPGQTATIINYFKNTGGGYDDFTLTIQPVSIAYSLYIDDIKITDIQSNTLYESNLQVMTNLPPNTSRVIKITALIPANSLGVRYDFLVTAKSRTSPYPSNTVLNIDPEPF